MEGVTVIKNTKKKKVKHDFDRIKQAEKKKRRLEKALATSAAICSELEKKKLKKKEQERLDKEGAAVAEAVALHVLIGEDSDDDPKNGTNSGDFVKPLVSCLDQHENLGLLYHPYTSILSSHSFDRYFRSADYLVAQAISSLQIADDASMDAYGLNPIFRG